ncbi:uncharacterized protein LOC106398795 [Brassica napus]|uniref:uncharacterized protein LOC106398795 n=1 Tax=Brassica napus TaxID=3708 RepID=UPI00207AEA87|nr:uncharacterized protein LOC106398795 [Brassica napus]
MRNKLEAKSVKGMFIGYSYTQKGYKCYIPNSRRVMVSRDVKFVESKGYYEEKSWENLQDLPQGPSDRANNLRIILESLGISQPRSSEVPRTFPSPPYAGKNEEASPVVETSHHDPEGGNEPESQPQEGDNLASTHDQDGDESDKSSEDQCNGDQGQEESVVERQQIQPLRMSTRVKKPSKWVDTRMYFNSNAAAHPIQATCSLASYPQEHVAFISNLDQEYVPKTYEETMEHEEWRESVGDEVGAMIKIDTWYETELPKGKKAVTSRLLFTIKYLANGKPERKKTRLMDVKNAFLQGELEDEVYMRPPPGSDKESIISTKAFLKSTFDIKDLGELKYFQGIEICRSKEGLFLSQRKYALDLLNEAWKLGAKVAKTPLEEGYKVLREGEFEDKLFGDFKLYRRMVGKLIYLTITRPDICFAVNQVSQHMQAPKVHHWNMVERIMRYIREAPGQGVWMGCNKSTEIVGYCDADWAGDRVDRRSTTCYCTFIGGNLVTCKSKKQKVVSCSSAEAEYRAMRKLTSELIWIRNLLRDLGIETSTPITMHCDNQAAIHIASNSVRQAVEQKIILPCYTRSEYQLADIFTKGASTKVCEFIHPRLGLIDLDRS